MTAFKSIAGWFDNHAAPAQGDPRGIDWLRVAFGGDYYPLSNVALGPFAGLDATTFLGGTGEDPRLAFQFTLGLRLALNIPGK